MGSLTLLLVATETTRAARETHSGFGAWLALNLLIVILIAAFVVRARRRARRARSADRRRRAAGRADARLASPTRQQRRATRQGRGRAFAKFLREYTAGLNRRDLKRLFDRDAASAYSVLTRDHARLPEPERRGRRLLFRAKLAFLGLSYKLTPARRAIFALSLLCIVVAVLTGNYEYHLASPHGSSIRVSLDFSPFWFLLSSSGLVFLLALELVDRIRVRDELEVARELQTELLPHGAIELPGYRIAHSYRTANEVGGDYYEVTPLPDGRVALMVGDATGHGMASGLVMAIANATLETALDLDPDPRRVIALLNRTLCRTGTQRTFMTVFYGLLTPATGELASVCAGHPFPLLRRAGGRVEELGHGGLPLGVRGDLAPEPQATVLAPGDLLVLYTDGLAEALDASSEAFGYDRIADLTRPGGTPQAVHDRILAAFDAHVGEEPLRDDLTLLVVAREGGGGEPGGSGGGEPGGKERGGSGGGKPDGGEPGESDGGGGGRPGDAAAEVTAKAAAIAAAIRGSGPGGGGDPGGGRSG
jgi:phosphoserine phosphatase RsbU/P